MGMLILGLVLFLGVHSVRIFANDWRTQVIAQRGENAWKGLYSVLSVIGLVLVVWGYGLARQQPVLLWQPPVMMKHLNSLFTLAAAYVPRNHFKARLHHPMVLGVKVWALAHLLSNGYLADVVLFGAFLLWSVLSFRAARARDRAAGTIYPSGNALATGITAVVGTVLWLVFTLWLHVLLIGVRPFGG